MEGLEDHGPRESGLLLKHLLQVLGEGALELCTALTGLRSLSPTFSDLSTLMARSLRWNITQIRSPLNCF